MTLFEIPNHIEKLLASRFRNQTTAVIEISYVLGTFFSTSSIRDLLTVYPALTEIVPDPDAITLRSES